MVVRGWLNGQPITLSLKRGALTVALDAGTVLTFDREGRLWSVFTAGHHFRRGLNGSVLAKWRDNSARRRRRLLRSESDLLLRRVSLFAQELCDRSTLQTSPDTARDIKAILARAAAFDIQAASADMEHYHRVYKPIGILPPDQYLALILQVTEGCSFNTCTFCTFYKDRPFRIKSPQELRAHIVAVRAYLGGSILMRQGIFLADANAMVVPQRHLMKLLDVITEEFGKGQRIYAFLDGFSGRKKTASDYAALAQRGLRRVYVGLESGHDPLLAWVRKPGRAADAIAAVHQMKLGGLNASVIVMLGLGGERYAEGHVQDTIDIVNQMALSQGDLLYFSEFIPHGTPYAPRRTRAVQDDCRPLSRERMQDQRQAIIAGLRFGSERPQISTYDIREFMY